MPPESLSSLGVGVDPNGPSGEFWERCRQHELPLQRCSSCSQVWHPPGELCPHCSSPAWEWVRSTGTGTVYAATTIHHAAHPAAEAWLPYTVVLVDLDEGTRMVSRLLQGAAELPIGTRVHVTFEDYAELTLPIFVADAPSR